MDVEQPGLLSATPEQAAAAWRAVRTTRALLEQLASHPPAIACVDKRFRVELRQLLVAAANARAHPDGLPGRPVCRPLDAAAHGLSSARRPGR